MMIEKKEKILSSREERYQKIKKLKSDYNAVITVKTNIPGDNKNLKIAYSLVKLFIKTIPNCYIDEILFFDSNDGPYYIIGSKFDAKIIKKSLITIEDSHELGRFIDLDVFDGNKTLSRDIPRKCYLCNNIAFDCIRLKKHSVNEIIAYIENKSITYFETKIFRIIDDSILLELNLHPKFGLVTPNSKGSHKDMNYRIMFNAKEVLVPFFVKMFRVGWDENIDVIFTKIKLIGLEAEKAMYKVTNNVNAYKGLIFNFGILLSAYGYIFRNHHDLENIFNVIMCISKDVLSDFDKPSNTYGYQAYKKYKVLGARGEAKRGMPNVEKSLVYLDDFSKESRINTLMYLISVVEDTVLLKRCVNFEEYLSVKNLFRDNLFCDENRIEELNKYCVKKNYSFGGSADLLILAIFLKKIKIF
ncbi:MAG: triphosphoribosyl-dephospho-CoA synthase [Sphaerochaetaceae bacterium]|nr:triphosphoribosyl-dephospho-CoA synthase [Sphaerochaetaceae bacterium]